MTRAERIEQAARALEKVARARWLSMTPHHLRECDALRAALSTQEGTASTFTLTDRDRWAWEAGWKSGVAYACTQIPDDSRFRSQIVDDLMDASPPPPPAADQKETT